MMLKGRIWLPMLVALSLVPTLLTGNSLAAEVGDFELNGYVREYLSFNLEDAPETRSDDQYDMSMNRLQALLQLRGKVGRARMAVIGRVVREQNTKYLRRLEDLAVASGGRGDFKDQYDQAEIREAYLDIPVGERVKLRLGKQQVVWGQTDFFQAMDVIHGYDQTWRAFLEPENEEWRKPLILFNGNVAVPELKGSLQMLVRPGFDDEEDIGNSYDMFGGRWAQNGNRGFDTNAVLFPIDYHHSEGDTDDAHFGARWSGTFGSNDDVVYSLNYYHTQAQNPVIYTAENPSPTGLAFAYPEIDIQGGTLSGYIPFINTVYRIEAAYIPDKPFNNVVPGINNFNLGVIEKDVVRSMLGLDTSFRLQNLIGTSNSSMLSLQVFDTNILDYEESELIVNAFGTTEDEHTTLVTGIFTLPYKMDTITGELVAVKDVSHGGGVLAPSVEFDFGPSWRVKFEADLFFGGTKDDVAPTSASLFGSYANNNQFLTRITYQF